jgi:ABC-type transport system involved in multi-copper enzyme maturation permease subunit
VKASTHTEVYRPFRGRLAPRRLRFVPLLSSCIKTATKRRLPLVLLFAPLAIGTVIFSFTVYAGFAIQAGDPPSALGSGGGLAGMIGQTIMSQRAQQLIQAREMIVNFHLATNFFSLLLMAWYGAGVLAEDRRVGAHLLYFARPLSRFDYVFAKFLTIAYFGLLSAVLPGLVICAVATFASPEWSFLLEEYDVIFATIGFGLLSTILVSSIVLSVSSLSSRRSFALVGVFATIMLTTAAARILSALQRDQDFQALSPMLSSARIATAIFDLKVRHTGWNLTWAWASVVFFTVLSWIIVWVRTRRMDVVQ